MAGGDAWNKFVGCGREEGIAGHLRLCGYSISSQGRVPRQALWKVLEKYGVPEKMLNVVKSFHEGMHAEVRVGSTVTDRFEVRNGLRQGCTLAPTLFNIYC